MAAGVTPILEFEGVHYHYPVQLTPRPGALHNFSVQVPAGEKVAVVGRNGSGKSTFFLHCNGLYQPHRGRVLFKGQPLRYDRQSLKQLRQHVGLVFQNPDDQLFSASVAQDISFGPLNLGLSEAETRRRVQQAADLCDIDHLLERPTHALSSGEKARVALAGVLAMEPELLVADELLSSLDPWMRLIIFEILQKLHDQGKTILLATHDLSVVRYWASYVLVLRAGQIAFAGPPDELLNNRALLDATELSLVWWDVRLDYPEGGLVRREE